VSDRSESTVIDDVELACRLLDDDESALGRIIAQFGGSTMRFLVAKYQDFTAQDAEDILSIAIHKLWENRQQYDESHGSLRTYLFKIADNTAKDVYKVGWQKAKRLPVDFGIDNDVNLISEVPPPNETKRKRKDREKKEKREIEDLNAVIDELPDKQRRIIRSDAHAKDRVSDSSKLADELGIPIGTVRVYRSRAWNSIRNKMKQLGYELPKGDKNDG